MIALSSKIDWPSNIVENIANGGILTPSIIPDVIFPKMQTSNYFAFGLPAQNVFLESEYVPASEYVSGIRREFPANSSEFTMHMRCNSCACFRTARRSGLWGCDCAGI
jgi:hypothetical protein